MSGVLLGVYGVNVYPIVLSKDEYIMGLSGNTFIMSVHSEGEILHGEKPRILELGLWGRYVLGDFYFIYIL